MADFIPAHPVPPPPPPSALPPPPGSPPGGWLNDPQKGGRERYWDGTAWTEQTRHANSFKRRFHFSPWWLLALVVLVVSLWAAGIFDTLLVDAGLNAQDCYQPPGGDWVCGSEAEQAIEAEQAREQAEQFLNQPTPGFPDPNTPFPDPSQPGIP